MLKSPLPLNYTNTELQAIYLLKTKPNILKQMKRLLITLMSLLVLLVTLNNLQAQDKKAQHKVHLKVKKVIDGKETVVDSVFTIDGDADLDEIMKSLGHDKAMKELHKHTEGDKDIRIEKKVEKRMIMKGDGEEEIVVDVEIKGVEGEEGNVFIFKSDDGEEKRLKIDIDDEDADKNVFIMKSDDGKIIEIDTEGDENIFILKDGKKVDVDELMEKEGSGKKVIRIKTDGDGESKMIWHSDDGKVIEVDGDKVKKKEMIFIRKSADGEDIDINDEEIKKMLKEKGIDWEEMDTDNMIIKKSSDINVNISPINEEDKAALLKVGVEEKDLAKDLELSEMTLKVEHDGPVLLQVETEGKGHLSAIVRDTAGEVVSKTVLKESSNAYKVYLNLEESGTYYVTLMQGGKSLTQKLVIKKA